MIAILSPAKTLDFERDQQLGPAEAPALLDHSAEVMNRLREFSPERLEKLQNISTDLARLNYERNQAWAKDHSPAAPVRQAALAFQGDVYQGLEAPQWSAADMDFARDHLLILSGLYGVLRPHEAIRPYRLEMGTSLPVKKARQLYDFWQVPLQQYFKQHIPPEEPLINLASKEYFKALEKAAVPNPVVQVQFKDEGKNGQYRVVAYYAKKARGRMAHFIVQNRLEKPEDLRDFNLDRYSFAPDQSSADSLTFLRDHKS